MNLDMTRVGVWVADIDDKPGAMARLLRAVADYGADLECVIARRDAGHPGHGAVFVSPLTGRAAVENADQAGLRPVIEVATLRIEGPNEPGMGSTLAKVIADAGINLHGFSAMTLGHRFVCYAGFDNTKDLETAETALKALTAHDWRFWRHGSHLPGETAAESR